MINLWEPECPTKGSGGVWETDGQTGIAVLRRVGQKVFRNRVKHHEFWWGMTSRSLSFRGVRKAPGRAVWRMAPFQASSMRTNRNNFIK